MFETLPPDIIAAVVSEWFGTFDELVHFDESLVNYCLRENYLLALQSLKKISYEEVATFNTEKAWKHFAIWKKKRGIIIDRLKLELYSSSMDNLLIKSFSNLKYLEIDDVESNNIKFDLSLIAFGNFPKLEVLHLINLEVFFDDEMADDYESLALKELHFTTNQFQPLKKQ